MTTPGVSLSPSFTRLRSFQALLLPMAVYLMLASWAAFTQREQMNTDAVCYLRHAFYIATGRWADSVSGYWSPLLIWSLAPFIGIGMDGVYAGHLVMVLWGAVLLGAAYIFLRRFTAMQAPWDMILLLILAVKEVGWVARLVTPDVAMAAALLFYSAVSLSPGLLLQRRVALAAGVLGGISYLAKSYGLPFFLAHFSCVVALRFWQERNSVSLRRAAATWLTGVLAFLIVAGPWIVLLSVKYGKPTFSTVARVAHTVVGPPDMLRAHPTEQLRTPPPGRLTVWEVPSTLPYNTWSPTASASYFKHQVKVVAANAGKIIATFHSFDLLELYPAVLVLLPLWFFSLALRDRIMQTLWTWSAVGIYAAGFLPIFFEDRYIYPYVWPICFFYLFGFLYRREERAASAHSTDRVLQLGTAGIKALCLLSFMVLALFEFLSILRNPATPAWRQLAAELQRLNCPGPLAISPGSKTEGLLTAYHLNSPFLGPVTGTNTAQIEENLRQFGAGTLLVREAKWQLPEQFLPETSWRRVGIFDQSGVKVYIFTNPNRP